MDKEIRRIAPMTHARLAAFLQRVEENDGHWIWTGATNGQGYGRFWDGTQYVLAHRAAYVHYVGPIPAGHVLDHTCRTTLCVRPAHLRPATHKQNMEHRGGAQANSSTGVRGVYWEPERGKFRAVIGHHGKWIRVGRFDSIEEAAEAVESKRAELFTHDDAAVA